MFTGLVEEIGKIKKITKTKQAVYFTIEATKVIQDAKVGDSISTNGVCLTVTAFHSNSFEVYAMPETIRITNLGQLKQGDSVNLERALQLSSRLGGHIVSGHCDGTGKIVRMNKEEQAITLHIKADESLLQYITFKGSIAIDGVSLTIMDKQDDFFGIAIIPHTQQETTLTRKKVGDTVNLECDIFAKYIYQFLTNKHTDESIKEQKIDEDFLMRCGF